MKRSKALEALRRLARLNGVETHYIDVAGHRCEASPEALLAILRSLGTPLGKPEEAPAALRRHEAASRRRLCEPVVVVWDGGAARVDVRLPAGFASELACVLELEDGARRAWSCRWDRLPALARGDAGGKLASRELMIGRRLPDGYHRLSIEAGSATGEALVIAAPRRAFPAAGELRRTWGVFAPLYALHDRRSWGSGGLRELRKLFDWIGEQGGGVAATLPVLASFLDEPFEPSPYSPVSRLFWNELYLDLERLPEMGQCRKARRIAESGRTRSRLERLRAVELVDYRGAMALKRGVLEELSEHFFRAGPARRRRSFERFLAASPSAEDYARFRSACERKRRPWPQWRQPARDGRLAERDCAPRSMRYHLYVQWNLEEQLQALSSRARRRGLGLNLDFPLGVHQHGYDVWREREAFASGMSGGAPPDAVFTKGQDWGFPPLHPHRLREQGYRYYLAALRAHLKHAAILRIDHVMSLHRLYWVPEGFGAAGGTYVRYPSEELYAILALESRRAGAMIAGENLGTVPPEVNPAMDRHNIRQTHVLQYELASNPRRALRSIPPGAVASFNTHDMFPFAGFWGELDIEDLFALGLYDRALQEKALSERRAAKKVLLRSLRRQGALRAGVASAREVFASSLQALGRSRAQVLLINLEDLWFEDRPQNVPGTREERPNWRRKARLPLGALRSRAELRELLRRIPAGRRKGL